MKNKQNKGIISRLIKTVFGYYPVMLPVTLGCILFSAAVSSVPAIFMQKVIAAVEESWQAGNWGSVSGRILKYVLILVGFYLLSLLANVIYNQLMAIITQGILNKMRREMFAKMERLPIKYFDTNNHGDIMSHYTNDIDTLRQMISQSFPQLIMSSVSVITVYCIMLYYCVWLTLVLTVGVIVMTIIIKKVGGGSAKFFFRQQTALGKVEGFAEEMMNGQKVVKVFCHENESIADFDKLNEQLFRDAQRANKYANILGPILNNIGNVLYVIVAVCGGILMIYNVPNLSISGLGIGISIVVPFLNMTKQFTGNINQVSHQVNAIVMGIAGTKRIFDIMDEEPEQDEGYVTLVNAKEVDGVLTECDEKTGIWAWKHIHQADGSVTYTKLTGDVRLFDVDFGYTEEKTVLKNISLYAKPGQKVAFVGATGAGKTTVTNLLNRFYDIADGKIRYDGININKIRKSDLRRALGIVLQDTNLFTGTVMENIRYGNLGATDEECIAAAKLAGADDFITRLPKGYDTELL